MEYNDLKYHRSITGIEKDPELRIVNAFFEPENKSILELGCHDGSFSKYLKAKGAYITGVDINPIAIEKAKKYCEKVFIGDMEEKNFLEYFSNTKYDIILALHVLEHLKDPWTLLANISKLLNEKGQIILALPNIGNYQHRVRMFKGVFDYEESGVMDKTHLRFFTLKTATEMIEKSGLKINSVNFSSRVDAPYELAQMFLPGTKTIMRNIISKTIRFKAEDLHRVMIFQCFSDQNA